MAPKKPQQPRTKGNVRASSSQAASEFVARSATGLVGFQSLQNNPALLVAGKVQDGDTEDSTLPNDFRITFKKLLKKDSTTKIKALQELCELVQTSDTDVVLLALPYWPPAYNKLATDIDRRVRTEANNTLLAFIQKAKKSFAPQLKRLAACWVCSQYDTYKDVAASATAAFAAAFPEQKRPEALSFCRGEISAYVIENILRAKPETLSDPKMVDEVDMEAKYYRTIAASIRAMILLVTSIPTDQSEGYASELLADKKFWRHAQSKSVEVRGAVYDFVATTCRCLPKAISEHLAVCSPTIFSFLDERERSVHSAMWTAVLSLVKDFPAAWDHANFRKAVFPKLRQLLKSAGYGSPHVAMTSLLPFTASVPMQVAGEGPGFALELLQCLWEGLQACVVDTERKAVGQAYVECLQFYAVRASKQSDATTCTSLLDALRSTLRLSLSADAPGWAPVVGKQLYEGTCMLVLTLMGIDTASQSTTTFMAGLLSMSMQACREAKQEEQERVYGQLGLLVQSLVEGAVGAQDTVLNAYMAEVSSLAAELGRHALDGAGAMSVAHVGLLAAILDAFTRAHRTDMFFTALSGFTGKPLSRSALLTDHVLPWLHQWNAGTEGTLEAHFRAVRELLLLGCSLLFVPGPESTSKLDGDHWATLWTELCRQESETQKAALMLTALQRVWSEVDSASTGHLDAVDVTVCELGHAMASQATASQPVVDLLMYCLHGPQAGPCQSQAVVGEAAVEVILASMSAVFAAMIDHPQDMNLGQATQLLGIANAYCPTAGHTLSPGLVPAFVHLLSLVLGVSTLILPPNTDDSGEATAQARDAAGLALCVFDAGAAALRKCSPSAQRQLYEVCMRRALSSLHTLTSGGARVDGIVSEVCVAVESVCEGAEDRQAALDMACPPVDMWVQTRGDLPPMCATDMLMDGILLLPLEENKVQACSHPPLAKAGPLVRLALYTASLIAHLGWDTFLLASEGDGQPTEALPPRASLRCTSVVWLLWAQAWAYDLLHAHNLHHTTMSDVGAAVELFQVVNEVDSIMAALMQDLNKSSKSAVYVRSLLVSSVTACREGDSLDMQVLRKLLRLLSNGGLISVATSETLLNSLFSNLPQTTAFTNAGTAPVQSALSALSVLGPTLPPSSQVLRSVVDTHTAVCLGQSAMAILNANTAPGLTSSLALVIACAVNMGSTARADLNRLVAHYSAVFAPAAQAARLRLAAKPTDSEAVSTCNASVQLGRLLLAHVGAESAVGGLEATRINLAGRACTEWLETSRAGSTRGQLAVCSTAFRLLCGVEPLAHAPAPVAAIRTVRDASEEGEGDEDDDGSDVDMDTMAASQRLSSVWTVHGPRLQALTLQFLLAAPPVEGPGALLPSWERRIALRSLKSYCDPNPPAAQKDQSEADREDELRGLLQLLAIQHVPTQALAYKLLLPRLLIDTKKAAAAQGSSSTDESIADVSIVTALESDSHLRTPPKALMAIVLSSPDTSALTGVGGGDVLLHTLIGRHWVHGYMLAWLLLLHCIRSAPPEVRADYALYLKNIDAVGRLLATVFELVPDPMHVSPAHSKGIKGLSASHVDVHSGEGLGLLAGHVYIVTLMTIPALCRAWFTDAPRKTKESVEKYTVDHVSPLIIAHEVDTVLKAADAVSNLKVKGSHVSREVTASYQLDEVSLEIIITMPTNYPLGMVSVESGTHFGLKSYRKWLLQMTTFLASQNGSIMEAVQLWQRNIDKKYEGVEECTICYSVIHGTNYSLPSLKCRTCKHKFHAACLYKWFQSSSQSTCPLCRSLI